MLRSLFLVIPSFLSIAGSAVPLLEQRQDPVFPFNGIQTWNDKNQFEDGRPCRPVTVIYARGTGEPGNIGGDIGQNFFQGMANLIGADNMAVQGVPYNADVLGYLGGGDPVGTEAELKILREAVYRCPFTRIVLGGYSQGGQILHDVAEQLDPFLASRISAAVIFGDPDQSQKGFGLIPLDRTLVFCNPGDLICAQLPIVLPAHLDYAKYGPEAALFVVNRLGF